MKTIGLSLDQAPQLSIPASFFLTIPIGVLLAAFILLKTGIAAILCFSIALPAFLLPLGWALLRAPNKDITVQGMRVSVVSLLPQTRIKTGLVLHLSSVLFGVLAIFFQTDWLAYVTGLLLLATAASMAGMLIHVLKNNQDA